MGKPRTEYEVKDGHLHSWIHDEERDGCWKLSLNVWAWVGFETDEYYKDSLNVWKLDPWQAGDGDRFRNAFAKQIKDGWGNGAVWLNHGTKDVANLWCDVDVYFTKERLEAQLCIWVVKNPRATKVLRGEDANGDTYEWTPRFGASCHPFGKVGCLINPIDMIIDYESVVRKADDSSSLNVGRKSEGVDDKGQQDDYYQQVSQHEFGHYLRLAHFCKKCGENLNSEQSYCDLKPNWFQDDIMAIGNKFRAHKVGIPFRGRLEKHHYVDTKVEARMCAGHTHRGGGERHKRPWPYDHYPDFETRKEDPAF